MQKILNLLTYLFALSVITAQPLLNSNEFSLERAISFALENNPAILIAQSEIDASKGRYTKNFWLPSPKLSLVYEAVPTGSSLKHFGERYIEVNQSIEYPAGIYYKALSLSRESDAVEEELNLRKLQITVQVKNKYFQALAGSEKVKTNEQNMMVLNDFLLKTESRLNIGEGTNLEYLTAKVHYKEAQNLLNEYKNDLRNAINELALTLGLDDTSELEGISLTDSLTSIPSNLKLDELLLKAEANPSLRITRLNLEKASYDRKLAWAKLLPGFDLSYNRETIGNDNRFYGVALGISIPLWFMFNERGEIQEASAKKRSAEHEFRFKKNEIITGIKNSFNNFQNQRRQLNTYRNEILALSEEVYRIAGASYDAGEISYLEFLQARQTFISARITFIDVLLKYNLSLVSLEEAVGSTLNTLTSNYQEN